MGLTESLYDYVLQSGNPALHPDRLYRCARVWGRCFWGKQYPDQEVSDDMENYRALELLHAGMALRNRTWQLLFDNVPDSGYQVESFFNEIMTARDVCPIPVRTKPILTVAEILRSVHHSQIRRPGLHATHFKHNQYGC